MVRSRTLTGLGELVRRLRGDDGDAGLPGDTDALAAEGLWDLSGDGLVVTGAEGLRVGSWPGVVEPPNASIEPARRALTLAPVTSWPARSMATQALTDTPATATSQTVTATTTKRSFTTMATLFHFPSDGAPYGVGLPDVDGLQVLAMLRAVSDVPVIVFTARDDDADMVKALNSGADDYVVKPFGIEQVDARLRAVLRRSNAAVVDGPLVVGGLTIDPRRRTVRLDGKPLDLSRKEFDLLLALAHRPGEVVTKRELLADVWRQSYGGGDRTVDVHLSWLRRKLGETAAEPRYLHSVRGVGVRLAAPDEASDGR